jgi:predicted nucleic acid-binding protein
MIIVSNTSPISNLLIIGEISLLQRIYPTILIPPAVYSELNRLPILQPKILSLLDSGWLAIRSPTNAQMLNTLAQMLDPGETEAIALAIEIDADRLLIDERLGRSIATNYGLKLRGILGLLVNAKQQGIIPLLQPILDRLIKQAGFRVSPSLYDRILQEVGEENPLNS